MLSALSAFEEAFEIKGEVGRLIDVATQATLLAPDLQVNMKICDTINGNPKEGSKDAARCLRRKLKHKSGRVVQLAVTVLEAVMQNCGPDLHAAIATKEFMGDVSALVLNVNMDMAVHRKVVTLVQNWGEGFRHMQDKVPLFFETYANLRAQGVRFPEYDAGSAPMYSLRQQPRPQVRAERTPAYNQQRNDGPRAVSQQQQQAPASVPTAATRRPERAAEAPIFDTARLLEDLEHVTVEATLLCDILDAATQSGGGGGGQQENVEGAGAQLQHLPASHRHLDRAGAGRRACGQASWCQ